MNMVYSLTVITFEIQIPPVFIVLIYVIDDTAYDIGIGFIDQLSLSKYRSRSEDYSP